MPTLLLEKPCGRLSDTTVIKILKRPEAWIALDSEQQQRLYAMLPKLNDAVTDTPMLVDTTIHPLQSPVYGEALKQFIAYIEKAISQGADKKAWQDEARTATLKRAEGAYDDSKELDREEYWGQKAIPTLITVAEQQAKPSDRAVTKAEAEN